VTKIVARVLLIVLSLALFASQGSYAATSSGQEAQYNPPKARKAYLKGQKRQQKKTRKAQKKEMKESRKRHASGS
jgi:hypothetical protein